MSGSFQDFSASSTIQNNIASIAQGRLTLTSNTPVLSSNVTGANTLYYTPYTGSQISIWDGSKWSVRTFTELSLPLSGLPANTNFDVFIYDNAGTLTLEAVAWSNSGAGTSTRASALSFLNGVRVKDSDKRKYLGSFRTTANIGQTEFITNGTPISALFFNEFNKVEIPFAFYYGTSHTYSSALHRPLANNTNLRFNIFVDNATINISYVAFISANLWITTGVNITSGNNDLGISSTGGTIRAFSSYNQRFFGYNYIQMLEYAIASSTFYAITLNSIIAI